MVNSEASAAREYWSTQGRNPFYETSQHWRTFVADRVARHNPDSVLEFGCNVGRNLVEVRKALPKASLTGFDVNEDAIRFGTDAYGLDLRVGGEELVAALPDDSVDVVFTVSVLDHLPEVSSTFRELARVARVSIILLEPYTGAVGRTDRKQTGEAQTRVPFTYAWDYALLCRSVGDKWNHWTWQPYPLSSENMGPYYWLIEGSREASDMLGDAARDNSPTVAQQRSPGPAS